MFGTAPLNLGIRTHIFAHSTLDFGRANANLKARVPKILSRPRPLQEIVSARLEMGPRTIFLIHVQFGVLQITK